MWYVGYVCCVWFLIFGIVGKFVVIIFIILNCVLGGMIMFFFIGVVVFGIYVLNFREGFNCCNWFIVIMFIGVGMGVIFVFVWVNIIS